MPIKISLLMATKKRGITYGVKSIDQKLRQIPLTKYARQSGFEQRKSKKITGRILLLAFIAMAMRGNNTFQHWAQVTAGLTGKIVSKQGIWKKITAAFVEFLNNVLQEAFRQQIHFAYTKMKYPTALNQYKRILIQDSTVISLPDLLSWCFPGNKKEGKQKAQLKIQVIYELLTNRFVSFQIMPCRINDQSRAQDILALVHPGDLVIRDLGYFVFESFNQMCKKKTSFISKLRWGTVVYDLTSGGEINLLQTLKFTNGFDGWVLVGRESRIKLRLVALKLPPQQVESRKRKAKRDNHPRTHHSKKYYQLLEYEIFITTETEEQLDAKQIAQLYSLRWRIETIFKCWKSNLHLQKLIPRNYSITKERAEAIIYMMLIFILLFQTSVYHRVLSAAQKIENHQISLMKLSAYIAHHIQLLFENNLTTLIPQILYYCKYEKRNDRKNFIQKLQLS